MEASALCLTLGRPVFIDFYELHNRYRAVLFNLMASFSFCESSGESAKSD